MGSHKLSLDHRFDWDITQQCITLEEEVLEFLLRSYSELQKLLELVNEAKKNPTRANNQALIKKALRKVRGFGGIERVERRAERTELEMSSLIHGMVEEFQAILLIRPLPLASSHGEIHFAADPTRKSLVAVEIEGIDQCMKKIKVFEADLVRLCSRAGAIEEGVVRATKDPTRVGEVAGLLTGAVKDVTGFEAVLRQLIDHTQKLQRNFEDYKPIIKQEMVIDEKAFLAAKKVVGHKVDSLKFEEKFLELYRSTKRDYLLARKREEIEDLAIEYLDSTRFIPGSFFFSSERLRQDTKDNFSQILGVSLGKMLAYVHYFCTNQNALQVISRNDKSKRVFVAHAAALKALDFNSMPLSVQISSATDRVSDVRLKAWLKSLAVFYR